MSDCRGLSASGAIAADTRKMSFRYSQLCGTASDAVDAVITPEADKDRQSQRVLNFKNINRSNSLKKINLVHEFENKWKRCTHPTNISDEHHFLICNECHNVEEVFLDYKQSIADQLLEEKKFRLEHVHLGFLGLCKNCY